MPLSSDLRKEWSLVRYQYYASGRADVIFSNLGITGVILGYAIETSYKHLLHELDLSDKGIIKCHSVKLIHNYLLKKNAEVPQVSNDFLDFIDNHLHSRYPSQRYETSTRIEAKNRFFVFNSLAMSFYDDLMFQLDNLILKTTNDDYHASVFFRGATDCLMSRGQFFFHGNYHAYLAHNEIIKYLETHGGLESEIEHLKTYRELLFDNDQFQLRSQPLINIKYTEKFCKDFVYPHWENDPITGKPTIIIKNPILIGINIQL